MTLMPVPAIDKGGRRAAEAGDGGPAMSVASPAQFARDCGSALPGRAKTAAMRGGETVSGSGGDELTARRVFRALYGAYDLHSVEGIHVVAPRGTPCFAGSSLGDVARKTSDHEQREARRA